MQEKNMSVNGEMLTSKVTTAKEALPIAQEAEQPVQQEEGDQVRRDSFQYQSRVPPKKLLCLKV